MKNHLSKGLKLEGKLTQGFYYYLVKNNIDWVILCLVFSMFPYLGSSDIHFLIIKSVIFVCACILVISYLRLWNRLRKIDILLEKSSNINKRLIKTNKWGDVSVFMKSFNEFLSFITIDFEQKVDNYKSFEDYIRTDQNVQLKFDEFFNKDRDITSTAIGFILEFFTTVTCLRSIPQLKMRNFNKLILMTFLIVLFFVIYAIEISF